MPDDNKPDWGMPYYTLPWEYSSRIIHKHGWMKAYDADVVPSEMVFGAITAGNQSAQQIATVVNAGYLPLTIKSINVTGDWLVSSDCPTDTPLDVGKSCSISLIFQPQRAGMQSGALYVDTGDAAGTEYVSLLGQGVASGKGSAGLSNSSWDFGAVTVGTSSPTKTITLSNLGDVNLLVTAISVNGEFSLTSSAPITLVPGGTTQIIAKMTPVTEGNKSGLITIAHNGTGATSIALSGSGVAVAQMAVASIGNAVLEAYANQATVIISVDSVAFDPTTVGSPSVAKGVLLSNSGLIDAHITSVNIVGDYALTPDSAKAGDTILANNGVALFKVVFTPTASGNRTGTLSINTDAATGAGFTVSLSGSATAAPVTVARLAISGNQFVKASDGVTTVRLKSCNWFGAEGTNYTPHGTWARSWKSIIDDIKGMGFNCIRFPFSGNFTDPGRTPPQGAIDVISNPDLVGLNALEIFDKYFDYCNSIGVYVVLDHHLRQAGAGADGSPIDGSYTLQNWKDSWAVMANRYANHPAVVGADLHNEPYTLSWATWAGYVESCANYLLTLAPLWLYFVEGVGTNSDSTSYWWGGALKDAGGRPIVLTVPKKVVYSPHEYGQSVGTQPWLETDDTTVSGYPNNLYAVWRANWGYIFETAMAPVWVGEFGGKFGMDGSGNHNQPNGTPEIEWLMTLEIYLNGDFEGDATSNLTGQQKGFSYAYWAYNPNSGDTGGLLMDDWVTHQANKLALLADLFK